MPVPAVSGAAGVSPGRHRVQEPAVTYPTEPKVKSSTAAGAAAATLITPVVVRIADRLLLDGDGPRTLPIEYVGLVGGVVVAVCAWAAGWLAPHVERIQPPSDA